MSELDRALDALSEHPGVQHVLILGRDGLLVQHQGSEEVDPEAIAALVPGLASACAALGEATGRGDFRTAVAQMNGGVAVVTALADDLLLAILLRAGVGFAPLLREVASRREALGALV
ncbi:MAG: roadblock/LC7 domain-containing protein [Gemmatimonadota bacterium]|jgi:predicted regulator of Ras-like GTPase activity (Roadblock/LC7/MglB family)|nr:roadblock/LC7 domain-containing protein [Gemmatimonadota bacterium]